MKKNWLVCRKGKILGPLSEVQIREMLDNKTLSLLDEVTQPFKKWVYLRNTDFNPLFEGTSPYHSISDDHSNSEDIDHTVIENLDDNNSSSRSREQTLQSSKNLDSFMGDKTKESTIFSKDAQSLELENLSSIEDIDKDIQIDQAISVVYSAQDDTRADHKTFHTEFGSIDQIKKNMNAQSVKFMQMAWAIIGFGFTVALVVYIWQNVVLEKRQQSQHLVNTLHEARQFFSRGEYEKSLNLFKKVPVTRFQDKLLLSSLILQVEGDPYRAQINLENISSDKLSSESQMRELVLQGMIEYKNGNYQLAQNYFKKAEKISSSHLATINNVILYIQTGKKEKALQILNGVSLNKKNRNFILFLKSYLSLNSKETEVDALLNTIINKRGDYAQEASLLSLYRDIIIMKKNNIIPRIQKLLDQDPYLTQEHFYDILSYKPQTLWKDLLLNLCSEVVKKSEGQSAFMALQSLCFAQSGLWASAQANIEKALNQSPKDSLVQAVYGYILLQNNQEDLSQIPVVQSMKNNVKDQYIIPFILNARWCEQTGQLECAEKHWKKVKENKLYFLSSLGGLLRVYSKLGFQEKSLALLNEGLKIAPHYKYFLPHKNL